MKTAYVCRYQETFILFVYMIPFSPTTQVNSSTCTCNYAVHGIDGNMYIMYNCCSVYYSAVVASGLALILTAQCGSVDPEGGRVG